MSVETPREYLYTSSEKEEKEFTETKNKIQNLFHEIQRENKNSLNSETINNYLENLIKKIELAKSQSEIQEILKLHEHEKKEIENIEIHKKTDEELKKLARIINTTPSITNLQRQAEKGRTEAENFVNRTITDAKNFYKNIPIIGSTYEYIAEKI